MSSQALELRHRHEGSVLDAAEPRNVPQTMRHTSDSACCPRESTEKVLNQLKVPFLFHPSPTPTFLPLRQRKALGCEISPHEISWEQVSQKDCVLSRPAPGSCWRPGWTYKTLCLPLLSGQLSKPALKWFIKSHPVVTSITQT